MSERETSPWAAPAERPSVSYEQRLQDSYGDLENPDDIDDMKMIIDSEKVGLAQSAELPEVAVEQQTDFQVGESVNVRRSSGEVEAGWSVVESNASRTSSSGDIITGVKVEKKLSKTEVMTKFISADALREVNAEREPINRDEIQEDIAEEALEAVGVQDPSSQESEIQEDARLFSSDELRAMREAAQRTVGESEQGDLRPEDEHLSALDRLKQGLSEDDVHYLESYARYQQDKRDAQQAGDNRGSRDAQEGMGWHYRRMSDAAKDIRNQFAYLYNGE